MMRPVRRLAFVLGLFALVTPARADWKLTVGAGVGGHLPFGAWTNSPLAGNALPAGTPLFGPGLSAAATVRLQHHPYFAWRADFDWLRLGTATYEAAMNTRGGPAVSASGQLFVLGAGAEWLFPIGGGTEASFGLTPGIVIPRGGEDFGGTSVSYTFLGTSVGGAARAGVLVPIAERVELGGSAAFLGGYPGVSAIGAETRPFLLGLVRLEVRYWLAGKGKPAVAGPEPSPETPGPAPVPPQPVPPPPAEVHP